jgi:AraC-like DNA-binding protein
MKGVIELLGDAGVDVATVLNAAGIDGPALEDSRMRVPTEKVSALWQAAVAVSGDPAICLVGSRLPKPGNFDVVGFAMLTSRNLRAAIDCFGEHMRLVSDAAQIETIERGDTVEVRFDLFGGRSTIPRQRMEFDLLTILTFCRWVSGRRVTPLAVLSTWPSADYSATLAPAFGCELKFNCDFNGLLFASDDMGAPLPASNPLIAKVHDEIVQQQLAIFDGASLSMKVREEIASRLVSGEPRREVVATALNVSDRTLRRRLEEEGVSYEKLLDLARCDLAQHYLARPTLPAAKVAHLLGFADQSAFFRACRRWFGVSPGQFRRQLRQTTVSDEA